jgi:hypothetical protein
MIVTTKEREENKMKKITFKPYIVTVKDKQGETRRLIVEVPSVKAAKSAGYSSYLEDNPHTFREDLKITVEPYVGQWEV